MGGFHLVNRLTLGILIDGLGGARRGGGGVVVVLGCVSPGIDVAVAGFVNWTVGGRGELFIHLKI